MLWLTTLLAAVGIMQAMAGWRLVRAFRDNPAPPPVSAGVTVLKPLHGDEPGLEEALATLLASAYQPLQIVFGVHSEDDPALVVLDRLQRRFPDPDVAVVIDGTEHGSNPKVSNLLNMLPKAKHDVLVIADSDVWCLPGYIEAVAATAEEAGTGLATVLYAGRPGNGTVAAYLGASWINHTFLPGAMMARLLGRQDALGATMALRRGTLEAIGGLEVVANELADDQMLGQHVLGRGLEINLAPTMVATTVGERTLGELWRHELRWGRTIRALAPVAFAASSLQHPIGWALLGVVLSGGGHAAWTVFAIVWLLRARMARRLDRQLAGIDEMLATRVPFWLFPLRDLLSLAVIVASYCGTRVEWRGQVLHTTTSSPPRPPGSPSP